MADMTADAIKAFAAALSAQAAQPVEEEPSLANIESPFNACMHKAHCLQWKAASQPVSSPTTGGWQPIDAHYEVSTDGEVRKIGTKEMLGQWSNSDGYLLVRLSKPRRVMRVHRLVAEAFIPNVGSLPFVNHIDCDPENNAVSNLEWCTQAQNIAHSEKLGRMCRDYWTGKRSPNAALSDEQVMAMRAVYSKGGISLAELGNQFSVSKRCAGRVINREAYRDVL